MEGRIEPPGSVTVFGGATIDHIAATKDAPVMGASNPGTARTTPGGVAFNMATILARLGHAVRLVTRVGGDPAGAMVVAAAEAAGIATDHVGTSTTAGTATYLAALDDVGGLIIGVAGMEIFDEMTPATVAAAAADAPAGDSWLVDANLPEDTLGFIIGQARAAGHPVAALAVSPAKCLRLAPLLHDIDLLFVNRKEAAALLATDDRLPTATALAQALCGSVRPNVVVTDADRPLAVASGGDIRSFVPLRAAIRSVNGAGDALAAGTIHGLASGRTLFEAIRPGLAAAAITMEHDGTIPPRLNAALLAARIGGGIETETS
ncbi:MAG: carbohydrate kinase [Bauldia sp.]|uniref:PfkB family carbohydrate kinase n=1 Tax=Bauldia sp. TaxID=2575872 RepID=UPI001D3A79D1|nr:PfkB family carbohydrate kinase [Bauldia sp.]MCB1495650.1 carbohydrate kinase [Bauldia sp.]